jgi:hypothetical protein
MILLGVLLLGPEVMAVEVLGRIVRECASSAARFITNVSGVLVRRKPPGVPGGFFILS